MINYEEDIVSEIGPYEPCGKELHEKLVDSFSALPALGRQFVSENVEREWVEEALKISEWLAFNMMRNAGCIMLSDERQAACDKLYAAQKMLKNQMSKLEEKLKENEQAIYVVLGISSEKDGDNEEKMASEAEDSAW